MSPNGLVDSGGFVGREVDHNVVPLILASHSDRFVARSPRPTAAAARLASVVLLVERELRAIATAAELAAALARSACSWSSASSA